MSALELHNYLDLNVMWDKRGRRQKLVCANSAGATQKAGVMKIPILLQRLVCLFTEDVLSTTTADTQKTWTFNIPTKRPTPSIHLGFSTWRDSSIPPGRCGKLWWSSTWPTNLL